jgi:hypothetical protein
MGKAISMKVNIDVINIPGTTANLKWAQEQPRRELPALTKEQRSIAKDLGMTEEQYGESMLARQYSEARYRRYAEQFGQFLAKAARAYRFESADVIYDGWDNRFHCWLMGKEAKVPLVFDANIIIAPLEAGDKNGLLEAEKAVKNAVEFLSRDVGTKRSTVASRH